MAYQQDQASKKEEIKLDSDYDDPNFSIILKSNDGTIFYASDHKLKKAS